MEHLKNDNGVILVDARPLVDAHSGGVRRFAEIAFLELLERCPETNFICITTGWKTVEPSEPFRSHPNVQHVHVRMPNKLWTFLSTLGIVALDREAEKRSGKTIKGTILFNIGFTGYLSTPFTLLIHDLSFLINPAWFSWHSRLWHIAVRPSELVQQSDLVFSVSETTSHDIARIFPFAKEKTKTVRLIDTERMTRTSSHLNNQTIEHSSSPAPSAPRPTPFFLILGGGDKRKNVETAISAIASAREETGQDIQLVIVGCQRSKSPSHDAPWILTKHRVSDDELDELYAHATAFLYPSWYEGYGIPLQEAARFGTPCIASTHGALPETAPEGTVFAPPAKPHLWTTTILDILQAPNRFRTSVREERTDISPLVEWVKRVNK